MKISKLKLIPVLTTIFIIILSIPIFIETFGSTLFSKRESDSQENEYFVNESRLVYLISSSFGQIGYSLFTNLEHGFLIFPVFEASPTIMKIHLEAIKDGRDGFINSLFSISFAAFLTFSFALLFYFFNLGDFLSYIPYNINIVIMFGTGIYFFISTCRYFITENYYTSIVFIIISFILTFGDILLKKYINNPKITIFYVILLSFIFTGLKTYGLQDFFIKHNLFPKKQISKLSLAEFYSKIYFNSFKPKFIFNNLLDIISLAMFPIISFTISLPSYCEALNLNACQNRELKSLAFANLFSSFGFLPTYFNFSGSVFFSNSGINTPLYSFIAGISMLFYYFFGHFIQTFFCTFIKSLLTEEIAIFLLLKCIKICYMISIYDKFIIILLLISLITFCKNNILMFLLLGLFTNMFISAIFSKKFISNRKMIECYNFDNEVVIKVKNLLDFYNIVHLIKCIDSSKKNNIVLDLTECLYVDFTANFGLFKAFLDTKSFFSIVIKTKRASKNNFYYWLYSKHKINEI